MLAIDDVLIDDGIPGSFFSCDLASCKGACCVEGELGAPVLEKEAESLREIVGTLSQRLPEKNRRYIRRHGCLEIYRGSLYTRTMDGRECVFAFRDKDITLCAIEKRKPLSCRLFPIRIIKKFGLDYLVYERHAMCRQAVKEGIDKGVPLIDYVAEALIDRYGLTWYRRLKDLLANSPMNYARH
ncbi:DUF3109 family protein [Prosthecochloris sp.]|uniref:DUF3109 family protein n=1 Tax=Prosthecochloris sp. TaxID=290513 RepID=UPI0025DB55D1|nr:DUF3109 family protein [Prosthecochloris sp.]